MANVVAQGISRKQIRAFTKYVRELCGMTDRMYFPVVEFLEIILPNLIDDFTYEIVEHSEMPVKREKLSQVLIQLKFVKMFTKKLLRVTAEQDLQFCTKSDTCLCMIMTELHFAENRTKLL